MRSRVRTLSWLFVGSLLGACSLSACGGSGDETEPAAEDAGVDSSGGDSDAATCPGSETMCGAKCVDQQSDLANCGACGTACKTGEVCSLGKCAVSCGGGTTECSGLCKDTQSDINNCGMCGTKCAAGQVCSAGKCGTSCGSGTTECSGVCRDTKTDRLNCGACGTTCKDGEVCSDAVCKTSCGGGLVDCTGVCRDTATDRLNCGACGKTCAAGEVCSAGKCGLSCGSPLSLCSGGTTGGDAGTDASTDAGSADGGAADGGATDGGDAGTSGGAGYCANLTNDRSNCGGCGIMCGAGKVCNAGTCETTCGPGLVDCGDGKCRDLSADNSKCGSSCSTATACGAGKVCSAGACSTSCGGGLVDCGDGICRDTTTDRTKCGTGCSTAVVCAAGQVCTAGACATTCATGTVDCGDGKCRDLATDNTKCGAACSTAVACTGGKVCSGGTCGVSCVTGQTLCGDGKCHDLLTDNLNCGACSTTTVSKACGAGTVCNTGVCAATCASPLTACGTPAVCTNTATDVNNCGTCGTKCASGQVCTGGSCSTLCGTGKTTCPGIGGGADYCTTLATDWMNCGACANVCAAGRACASNTCNLPGSLTVTTNTNLSTTNTGGRTCADGGDMVSYSVTALGANTATVSSAVSAGCLAPGEEVLLINLQGVGAATTNVGNWEVLRVASVSGTTVTFASNKKRFYGTGATDDLNLGTARTNQRVMLQRVPAYNDVTVNAGVTLDANPWNGLKDGVFAARTFGTVTVNGTLGMTAKGYVGGVTNTVENRTGQQGESIGGLGTNDQAALVGAGGGGRGDNTGCDGFGVAGGGGGYGAAGATAAYTTCGGVGGAAYGDATGSQVFLGSGGGAGGTDNVLFDNPPGGSGGRGGGIMMLWAAKGLTGTGSVKTTGGDGQGDPIPFTCPGGGASTTSCWDYSGPGGGGSGGSLWTLGAPSSALSVSIAGGLGAAGAPSGNGGNGAVGRYFGPTSCKVIHARDAAAASGSYMVDPDGIGGADAFAVYCDQAADGGGWTKILQYANTAYVPNTASVGDVTTAGTPAFAKLSDAQINAIGGSGASKLYRFKGDKSTKNLYYQTTNVFDDTLRANGIGASGSATACLGDSFPCTLASVTLPTIDTTQWGLSNDCDRYFTDYNTTAECFTEGPVGSRCYSAGASCGSGHPMIQNFSMWIRE